MVDGTRTKQLEAQVNQVNSLVNNLQTLMEALEVGLSKHHEGIQSSENKFYASMDGLAKRLDGFLQVFSRISQISLLFHFLLKENADPILEGNGPNPRPSRLPVLRLKTSVRDNLTDWMVDRRLENNFYSTPYVHNNAPMPELEIPLFDGKNLGGG